MPGCAYAAAAAAAQVGLAGAGAVTKLIVAADQFCFRTRAPVPRHGIGVHRYAAWGGRCVSASDGELRGGEIGIRPRRAHRPNGKAGPADSDETAAPPPRLAFVANVAVESEAGGSGSPAASVRGEEGVAGCWHPVPAFASDWPRDDRFANAFPRRRKLRFEGARHLLSVRSASPAPGAVRMLWSHEEARSWPIPSSAVR